MNITGSGSDEIESANVSLTVELPDIITQSTEDRPATKGCEWLNATKNDHYHFTVLYVVAVGCILHVVGSDGCPFHCEQRATSISRPVGSQSGRDRVIK